MADRELLGNCAMGALLAGSAVVWSTVFVRWRTRKAPPLERVAQEPVSWPAAPMCATFLVAFLMPVLVSWLVTERVGKLPPLSLASVQWKCAGIVAQIITVVGLLALEGPLKKEDFGCDLAQWRTDMQVGIAGCLASILPIFVVTSWQQSLHLRGPEDKHTLLQLLETSPERGILFWIVLSAAVLAPLAEELLFRVLLQGWVQSRIAPWQAIVFSTYVFVVQHAEYDWLPLIPLALILGYVYNRRRSYVAVVVLHALFNGVMLALAMVAKM